jgi:ribosome-binding factor A
MTPTGRIERLQDQIKKIVSEVIQGKLNDPHLGFITITEVELSRDLKHAKVFYSVYGDADSQRETSKSLKRATGFIQRELAHEIRIRKLPAIEFKADNSVARGLRIQELLDQIEKDNDDRQGN